MHFWRRVSISVPTFVYLVPNHTPSYYRKGGRWTETGILASLMDPRSAIFSFLSTSECPSRDLMIFCDIPDLSFSPWKCPWLQSHFSVYIPMYLSIFSYLSDWKIIYISFKYWEGRIFCLIRLYMHDKQHDIHFNIKQIKYKLFYSKLQVITGDPILIQLLQRSKEIRYYIFLLYSTLKMSITDNKIVHQLIYTT